MERRTRCEPPASWAYPGDSFSAVPPHRLLPFERRCKPRKSTPSAARCLLSAALNVQYGDRSRRPLSAASRRARISRSSIGYGAAARAQVGPVSSTFAARYARIQPRAIGLDSRRR